MGIESIIKDTGEFLKACNDPILPIPTIPARDRELLRARLNNDEMQELDDEIEEKNLAGILQESLDVIYVVVGMLHEYGLAEAAIEGWQELHASNMAKVDLVTGKVMRREDGKILKPDGWSSVNWQALVEKYQTGGNHGD